ncbi:hypothetical protein T492DRAFT_880286 [Pavlovales sp. CCMP2436]|nr:hypothetical protein T492DRAFT_880286 [Pavlovales sp. CCMP2436]
MRPSRDSADSLSTSGVQAVRAPRTSAEAQPSLDSAVSFSAPGAKAVRAPRPLNEARPLLDSALGGNALDGGVRRPPRHARHLSHALLSAPEGGLLRPRSSSSIGGASLSRLLRPRSRSSMGGSSGSLSLDASEARKPAVGSGITVITVKEQHRAYTDSPDPTDEADRFHFERGLGLGAQTTYHTLGTPAEHTAHTRARTKLRSSPAIMSVISRFWSTAELITHGCDQFMSQQSYLQLYERIGAALGVNLARSGMSARSFALADWFSDKRKARFAALGVDLGNVQSASEDEDDEEEEEAPDGSWGLSPPEVEATDGSRGLGVDLGQSEDCIMDFGCFCSGLFELCDNWTSGYDEYEYVAFLGKLFRRITTLVSMDRVFSERLVLDDVGWQTVARVSRASRIMMVAGLDRDIGGDNDGAAEEEAAAGAAEAAEEAEAEADAETDAEAAALLAAADALASAPRQLRALAEISSDRFRTDAQPHSAGESAALLSLARAQLRAQHAQMQLSQELVGADTREEEGRMGRKAGEAECAAALASRELASALANVAARGLGGSALAVDAFDSLTDQLSRQALRKAAQVEERNRRWRDAQADAASLVEAERSEDSNGEGGGQGGRQVSTYSVRQVEALSLADRLEPGRSRPGAEFCRVRALLGRPEGGLRPETKLRGGALRLAGLAQSTTRAAVEAAEARMSGGQAWSRHGSKRPSDGSSASSHLSSRRTSLIAQATPSLSVRCVEEHQISSLTLSLDLDLGHSAAPWIELESDSEPKSESEMAQAAAAGGHPPRGSSSTAAAAVAEAQDETGEAPAALCVADDNRPGSSPRRKSPGRNSAQGPGRSPAKGPAKGPVRSSGRSLAQGAPAQSLGKVPGKGLGRSSRKISAQSPGKTASAPDAAADDGPDFDRLRAQADYAACSHVYLVTERAHPLDRLSQLPLLRRPPLQPQRGGRIFDPTPGSRGSDRVANFDWTEMNALAHCGPPPALPAALSALAWARPLAQAQALSASPARAAQLDQIVRLRGSRSAAELLTLRPAAGRSVAADTKPAARNTRLRLRGGGGGGLGSSPSAPALAHLEWRHVRRQSAAL